MWRPTLSSPSLLDFEPLRFSAVQEQLGAILAEAADLCWANEELANRLVEATHLCDKLMDWACGSVAKRQINSNRFVVLERKVEAVVGLVQPMRSNLHEQALGLLA
jgi:hypothetical protein